jgi:hypothetical protein
MLEKRVVILPPHFDQGRKGVVGKKIETIIGDMWRVKLDDGHITAAGADKLQEVEG